MGRISYKGLDERAVALPGPCKQASRVQPSPRAWSLRVLPLANATLLLMDGDSAADIRDMQSRDQYDVLLARSDAHAFSLCGESAASRDPGDIIGGEYHVRTELPTHWLSLQFADDQVRCSHRYEAALLDHDIAWRVLRADSACLRARIALVDELFVDAREQAGQVRHHARHAAARQLLEDLVRAIHETGNRARGRRPLDRKPVIERCLDLIDAQLSRPISIEDLCTAAGVSDRTLRTMFSERFGVSPHRYLMNRRMEAIHAALCSAREGTTVTSVCSDYGVWDFGRFARQYRQLYGVLPSQDLRATRRDARMDVELMDPGAAWPTRAQFLRGGPALH